MEGAFPPPQAVRDRRESNNNKNGEENLGGPSTAKITWNSLSWIMEGSYHLNTNGRARFRREGQFGGKAIGGLYILQLD